MVKYFIAALLLTAPYVTLAQSDPFDIFGDQDPLSYRYQLPEQDDSTKSSEQLIEDALKLLSSQHPLDARSKLLLALKKDPNSYRAHMMLGSYYLSTVGHFRLALRYVLKAIELFEVQFGPAPHSDYLVRYNHGYLLRLLSQCRLNLDDYEGALKELDSFNQLGYYDESYAASRAWVLMKLGKTEEAIRVAQFGYRNLSPRSERGHVLNMLGILYSMSKRREDSINVFNEAIAYELSLGEHGQAATPLNNVGEVYREIFEERKAEESFSKALRLPDACEHVLPALNQSFLALEMLKPPVASRAMNDFAKCIAQFPLRNNEEHRALVQLAQGRIDLITGHPDKAVERLENALSGTQWFGKIGTQEEDFKIAAQTSLAEALDALSYHLTSTSGLSWYERSKAQITAISLRLKAWWIRRSAAIMAIEKLNDFEDLYVRHSDSFILYATLGSFLSQWPTQALDQRIDQELKNDRRTKAKPYYLAYKAQHAYERGDIRQAQELAKKVFSQIRPKEDALLRAHLLAVKAQHSSAPSAIAQDLFLLWRPMVRNFGLGIVVKAQKNVALLKELFKGTPLIVTSDVNTPFTISIDESPTTHESTFTFISDRGVPGTIRVKGPERKEAARKFIDAVFSEER